MLISCHLQWIHSVNIATADIARRMEQFANNSALHWCGVGRSPMFFELRFRYHFKCVVPFAIISCVLDRVEPPLDFSLVNTFLGAVASILTTRHSGLWWSNHAAVVDIPLFIKLASTDANCGAFLVEICTKQRLKKMAHSHQVMMAHKLRYLIRYLQLPTKFD